MVQCDYLMLKDTAGTGGLKVLSMCVRIFGYGMSTVVAIKGPTVCNNVGSENVEFPWTLRHHSAVVIPSHH